MLYRIAVLHKMRKRKVERLSLKAYLFPLNYMPLKSHRGDLPFLAQ